MGELLRRRVVLVAEADRIGERARRGATVGRREPERPGVAGERLAEPLAGLLQDPVLILLEELGVLAGIDADVDGGVVLAEGEADRLGRLGQAVENQPAQHRAAVIPERDHHRVSLAEQRIERHRRASHIREGETARHPIAEVLDDVDVLQRRQRLGAPLREDHLRLGVRRRCPEQERAQREGDCSPDLHLGAPSGSAPDAASSNARSIGMWTIPLLRSVQPYPLRRAARSARQVASRWSPSNST